MKKGYGEIGRTRERERERETQYTAREKKEEGKRERRNNLPRFEQRTWGVAFGGGRAWTGE